MSSWVREIPEVLDLGRVSLGVDADVLRLAFDDDDAEKVAAAADSADVVVVAEVVVVVVAVAAATEVSPVDVEPGFDCGKKKQA